jgi:betaine-aldehyde dehydrogenase
MTGAERARILYKTADLIEADLEQLALFDVLESGKPLTQARGEIASAVDIWRYAAGLARDVHGDSYAQIGSTRLGVVIREPTGGVSLITPWNFPFLILSQKLPFALAAGCTAVVKPSEMTSGSTLRLGKLLREAGLPPGVANIIAGTGPDVGAAMMSHPMVDMVSFTGSTKVGKQAMRLAADSLKKVVTELGARTHKSCLPMRTWTPQSMRPCSVRSSMPESVAMPVVALILERSIAESFLTEVTKYASTVKVGDPLDPVTKVGALISAEHLRSVEQRVAEAVDGGATLRSGGSRLSDLPGLFMSPTVLSNIRPDMRVAREEIFGPVVSAITFATTDDAVRIANDTSYGLSAAVWSARLDRCLSIGRRVRVGTVWMNTFLDGAPELPFGGYRESGSGRKLGRAAVEDYTETKTLHIHHAGRTAWWARPDRVAS